MLYKNKSKSINSIIPKIILYTTALYEKKKIHPLPPTRKATPRFHFRTEYANLYNILNIDHSNPISSI